MSLAVAADNDVALRFEKAFGALLRFSRFPISVCGLVEPGFEPAQLALHLPDAGRKNAQSAARRTEQRGRAHREGLGVVVRAARYRSRQKAEGESQTTSR
jgi:hypothetical protein